MDELEFVRMRCCGLCRDDGTGIHGRLKSVCLRGRAGSNPAPGTRINVCGIREYRVMYSQVTVDMALRLSAIGILDKENARICGVSVSAVRHWRSGRRRSPQYGPRRTAAQRTPSCPRCDGRSMDESAYAYLLGLYLYLGDGCITRGRRDVFALCI